METGVGRALVKADASDSAAGVRLKRNPSRPAAGPTISSRRAHSCSTRWMLGRRVSEQATQNEGKDITIDVSQEVLSLMSLRRALRRHETYGLLS